jgi:4-hydroxy-tetrahydrodipicolinate reductase
MAKFQVMVNGFPGKMAIEVMQVVLDRGWELIPFSMTGAQSGTVEAPGEVSVELLPKEKHGQLKEIKAKYPQIVVVDYTHPSAVNLNSELYAKLGVPFVMGTTGGDRKKLFEDVNNAKLAAVIAPNMGKPVVALQNMMEWMANEYPGVFEGSSLTVKESHQSTKADTSGTAKAIVSSFNKMGLDFGEDEIKLVREEKAQKEFGVPTEFLKGHAFHTYDLKSACGTVNLQFQHNVRGRRVYAEGTCDGVAFLATQIANGSEPKIYDMVDVLKSGGMN